MYTILARFWEACMGFFHSTQVCIPVVQIAMLLLLSTVVLLYGKIKLALLVNYVFTLYWGYGFNREYLLSAGIENINSFTLLYFGFGLVIAGLALIGFLAPSR